jgi:hypothetical protein
MQGKTLIITTMVMVVSLIVGLPVTGQTEENVQLKNYYNAYIVKCIDKNQSKTVLLTSRSENLRNYGAICKQKTVFLTNNQNALVDEMIKKEIGTKPYKIDYYLNKRFNGTKK